MIHYINFLKIKNLIFIIIMNKILLISFIFSLMYLLNLSKKSEDFTNVLLKNDIINLYNSTIKSQNIDTNILDLLFDDSINDDITLQNYFSNIKMSPDNFNVNLLFIKNILDNNNSNSQLEYNITLNTQINSIIRTWHIDNLKNSILKIDNKLFQIILDIINKPVIQICSRDKFIEHCEKNYTSLNIKTNNIQPNITISNNQPKINNINDIEKFVNTISLKQIEEIETNITITDNNKKFMDIKSLDSVLRNFNSKSFGIDVEDKLNDILRQYFRKYRRNVNLLDTNNFVNLVNILVSNIKNNINNLIDEPDIDKLKIHIDDFNKFKKIFYSLKHYYKLAQAYELINKNVRNTEDRVRALLCCSKKDENTCYNFSSIKDPSALIFGYNKFGFAKSVTCVNDSDITQKLLDDQEKTLDDYLNSFDSWKNASTDNKNNVLNNLIKVLQINNINVNINDKIKNIRLQILDNNINMSTIKTLPHDSSKYFILKSPEYNKIKDIISKITNLKDLQTVINKIGFEHIILKSTLENSKIFVLSIINFKEILENFNYFDNTLTITKLIGIFNTSQTFSDIMYQTNIPIKYHQIIIDYILNNLKSNNIIQLNNYTINSIPNDIIKYIDIKPSEQHLNLCSLNTRNYILEKLRRERLITIDEYINFNKQLDVYCNPDNVNIKDIKSNNIPVNNNIGLNVIERTHSEYNDFIKENKEITNQNLNNEVVSNNILFNFIRNTYN